MVDSFPSLLGHPRSQPCRVRCLSRLSTLLHQQPNVTRMLVHQNTEPFGIPPTLLSCFLYFLCGFLIILYPSFSPEWLVVGINHHKTTSISIRASGRHSNLFWATTIQHGRYNSGRPFYRHFSGAGVLSDGWGSFGTGSRLLVIRLHVWEASEARAGGVWIWCLWVTE